MKQAQLENVVEALNVRWQIIKDLQRTADQNYYDGMLVTVALMGYYWERKSDGTHILYKIGE